MPKGSGSAHLRLLTISFFLISVFMVAEVVGGIVTQSFALLSDAGHMVTDTIGLAMAIAIIRLGTPVDVESDIMLVIAIVGLVVNIIVMRLLRASCNESINVEGAYLEVWADMIGSIGVIFAAGVIWVTGWQIIDPLIGAAIAVFIVPRAWRLGKKAMRILLQIAPESIDIDEVRSSLSEIESVTGIHKLHVWTVSTGENVASAPITVAAGGDHHDVLDQAADLLETRFGIVDTTVQVEPPDHTVCAEDE